MPTAAATIPSFSQWPQAASSGLAASQARLDVAAHNIANASTAHYRRQQAMLQTQPQSGVQVQLRSAQQTVTGIDDSQIVQDQVEQRQALYQFQANLKTIKTGDTMLGALLDISA